MKKILITGAAGVIGTSLRNQLSNIYHIRCFDTKETINEEDVIVANLTDFKILLSSLEEIDVIIHLADNSNYDQPWQEVYHNGIAGTYNVFEAARQSGIKKIVYASSIRVHGRNAKIRNRKFFADQPVLPDTLYGIGKSTGESLARFFSETFEMSIICIRIGSFYTDPPFPQNIHDDILKSWCCPEDLAQLVFKCIETENLGFKVFYGVSNNLRSLWDIETASKLVNYQPKCNAEDMINPRMCQNQNGILLKNHTLLFQAAVLNAPDALKNWQSWLDNNDLKKVDLDIISYRLLPFIYFNLANQGINHHQMGTLKGIYRRTWLENQLNLKKLIPFIKTLLLEKIPILLMDDITSILRLYDAQGVRRFYSIDLLAQPGDIPKILNILKSNDIWSKVSFGERYLEVETAIEIWSPFSQPITLAWKILPEIKIDEQVTASWKDAQAIKIDDCDIFTLDLESHFVRSCIRAKDREPEAAFFSLVDIAWMLNKNADNIDWNQVINLIQENHKAIPVSDCLHEISSILDIPIIYKLLDNIKKLPISRLDRLEYKWVTLFQPFPGFFHRIIRRIILYLRSPKIPGLLGFIRYFQFTWGGARLLSLPRLLFKHFGELFFPSWKRGK